jgi:hypothetical protein
VRRFVIVFLAIVLYIHVGPTCDFPDLQKNVFHIFYFLENDLCFKNLKDQHKKRQRHASPLYHKERLPDTRVQVQQTIIKY